MSSAPVPTVLTLLSHLPSHKVGSKVRFLGCVNAYNSREGVLELLHASKDCAKTTVVAETDIKVILETVKREDLELGAWVNVMGYISGIEAARSVDQSSSIAKSKQISSAALATVTIQAIMLWNAGAINLADYEKAVHHRLQAQARKSE